MAHVHKEPLGLTGARSEALKMDLASIQLRQFYVVLQRVSAAAASLTPEQSEEGATKISDRLAELIELQSLEARREGGRLSLEKEEHARFIKAALADEILLSIDWEGKSYWRRLLLEERLFKTSQAGEKVFQHIDKILGARDPQHRTIALLYLHALSLGFQGRFRRGDQTEIIAVVRKELFQFVYQRPPENSRRERLVSASAYASTVSHLNGALAPKLSRSKLLLAMTVLLLMLVSQGLWVYQTWPLQEMLNSSVTASGLVTMN